MLITADINLKNTLLTHSPVPAERSFRSGDGLWGDLRGLYGGLSGTIIHWGYTRGPLIVGSIFSVRNAAPRK